MHEKVERRKADRVKARITAQYEELPGGAGVSEDTFTITDISKGGVRFITVNFIPMASRLVLVMELTISTKPVKVITKVAWMKKTPSGDRYEVGSQFLDMSKETHRLITSYIQNAKVNSQINGDAGEEEKIDLLSK